MSLLAGGGFYQGTPRWVKGLVSSTIRELLFLEIRATSIRKLWGSHVLFLGTPSSQRRRYQNLEQCPGRMNDKIECLFKLII